MQRMKKILVLVCAILLLGGCALPLQYIDPTDWGKQKKLIEQALNDGALKKADYYLKLRKKNTPPVPVELVADFDWLDIESQYSKVKANYAKKLEKKEPHCQPIKSPPKGERVSIDSETIAITKSALTAFAGLYPRYEKVANQTSIYYSVCLDYIQWVIARDLTENDDSSKRISNLYCLSNVYLKTAKSNSGNYIQEHFDFVQKAKQLAIESYIDKELSVVNYNIKHSAYFGAVLRLVELLRMFPLHPRKDSILERLLGVYIQWAKKGSDKKNDGSICQRPSHEATQLRNWILQRDDVLNGTKQRVAKLIIPQKDNTCPADQKDITGSLSDVLSDDAVEQIICVSSSISDTEK